MVETTETSLLGLSTIMCAAAFGAFALLSLFPEPGAAAFLLACSLAAASLLAALSSLERATHPSFRVGRPLRRRALLFILGILSGASAFLTWNADRSPLRTLADKGRAVTLEGFLLEDPLPAAGERHRFLLDSARVVDRDGAFFSARGKVTVLIPSAEALKNLPGRETAGDGAVLGSGRKVSLTGAFIPGETGTNDRFTARTVTVMQEPDGAGGSLRIAMRSALAKALLRRRGTGGLLMALLSGNREYLDPELELSFRKAGLSHVLALSGMHLGIIALIVLRCGRKIGGLRFSVRLSLGAMLFFVWFAGPTPSLLRALVMAAILFLTKRLGLPGRGIPVLCLSAVLQLLFRPADAVSPAFILSYTALGGILLFSPPLTGLAESVMHRRLASPLAASLAAQGATCGYTAAVFGTFVPFAPLAALLAGPLATLFLTSGILWLGLYLLSPNLALLLSPLLDIQYVILEKLVSAFASLPAAAVRDLPAALLIGIIACTALLSARAAHNALLQRRSPDAGFTGL